MQSRRICFRKSAAKTKSKDIYEVEVVIGRGDGSCANALLIRFYKTTAREGFMGILKLRSRSTSYGQLVPQKSGIPVDNEAESEYKIQTKSHNFESSNYLSSKQSKHISLKLRRKLSFYYRSSSSTTTSNNDQTYPCWSHHRCSH